VHSYDGRCARFGWSVCTVGVSTDGQDGPHGRRGSGLTWAFESGMRPSYAVPPAWLPGMRAARKRGA
jgi:hypothetical protein